MDSPRDKWISKYKGALQLFVPFEHKIIDNHGGMNNILNQSYMKTITRFLMTLLAVVGWNTAQAETVSPYEVDFNTTITTDGDFAVAPNWGHVVNTNVSYTYVSDGGVNGSGALRTYTNQKSKNAYDLLVTPLVSGTVTLYVKPLGRWYNDSAFLEFYSMDESGTTRGELLASTNFASKPNSEDKAKPCLLTFLWFLGPDQLQSKC